MENVFMIVIRRQQRQPLLPSLLYRERITYYGTVITYTAFE